MKNKLPSISNGFRLSLLGLFLRLSVVVLILSFNQVSASNSYAQQARLSVKAENQSLKHVLKQIERQSEFYFMYNDNNVDVTQKVSVDMADASIFRILDHLTAQVELEYKVVGKQIVLLPKTQNTPDETSENEVQHTVSGIVRDAADDVTLPGVNVVEKGTGNGTITDIDGKYTLALTGDPATAVLVFSYVGYQQREEPVNSRSTIDIDLRVNAQDLGEVVIIGYGQESEKLITSSIASVNEQEIERSISNGIQETLQGKLSGVNVTRNSGTPGGGITIDIRGKSSLSAGTSPLIVVDGIPVTSGDYSQISMEGQGIDAVTDINPNNIESISVLKDASAAAIYGARAGNGVILIKTKSGSEGKTRINFKSYYGTQKVVEQLDLMDATQWKNYILQYNPDFLNTLYSMTGDTTINTNWQDAIMRQAPIMNYELSFSGGNEKTRFYVSGRYFKQTGVIIGTDYDKYSGLVNVDHNVTDNFTIGAKINTSYSINDRVRGDQSINGVVPNAISMPPVYPVYDEYGNYFQLPENENWFWDNPVAIGNEVVNTAYSFRNISNVYGELKFLENFTFKNQWGFDYYNLHERRFEPSTVLSAYNTSGFGTDATAKVMKVVQQSTVNYFYSTGDHTVDLLGGYSFETITENYNSISKSNFPSDELQYLESGSNVEEASSSAFNKGIQSFFGRAKYNFADRYLLSFSVRADGSSNFGENNKYALLPAASFAWRISEEGFLADNTVLSDLKLKLSYGLTGNDQIGAFRHLNLYSSGYNYYGNPGIIPTQIPNPDLRWEETSNFNLGLDIGLFNDRVMFNSDFYYNKTVDLLLNRPLPGNSGYTSMAANVGELENQGMEFQLAADIIQSEFNWTTTFNISFNENKILKLYNDQPITDQGRGNNAAVVDEPIGVFYMYKSLGVDPSTGDLVFEDINNDGIITDEDRTVVGDPNPDFSGGFINNFSYKGFDLSIFIQFVYGNDVFNGVRQYTENMTSGVNDNQLVTIQDRWRQPGDETYIPRYNGTYNLEPVSSHYLEDGSYVRLRNITLAYNFAPSLLDRTGLINSAQIFVKGENLFTLTPYSGLDPEVNYSGVGTIVQGVDFFTYPQVRTIIGGIKLSF